MEEKLCYGCMQYVKEGARQCNCGFCLEEYVSKPHQLLPGTKLADRYLVGRVMGEGGFGITYVGRDMLLDMKVAVKEFYMSGYVNRNVFASTQIQYEDNERGRKFEAGREKYLNEARVLARFSDEDGIVGIRDFFEENNTAYIVMDFLTGETLRSIIAGRECLGWQETVKTMEPLFKSLRVIHSHNVIHRDISPDNIMITDEGKVKLLDFGAAREVAQDDIKTMSVVLRPGYAPEEQYRSKGVQGPWTDIYAICATMYHCITGMAPEDSVERMFEDELKAPAEIKPDCNEKISDIIMHGMAISHKDRYQSMEELQRDIEEVLSATGREENGGGRAVKKWIIAGAAVAAALIIAAVAIGINRDTALMQDAHSEETAAESPLTESNRPESPLTESNKPESPLTENNKPESNITDVVPAQEEDGLYDVSLAHVYFNIGSDQPESDRENTLKVIEERLQGLLPEEYSIEYCENHYELTFPVDALGMVDYTPVMDKLVFSPCRLFLAKNDSEYSLIDGKDIAEAVVKEGKPNQFEMPEEELQKWTKKGCGYIQITLSDDAAGRLKAETEKWKESGLDSGVRDALRSYKNYTGTLAETEDSVMVTGGDGDVEYHLSCYADFDRFLNDECRADSLWGTSLVFADEDLTTLSLVIPDASAVECEQFCRSLKDESFSDNVDTVFETAALWERAEDGEGDFQSRGEFQVDASYFMNNGITAYDIIYWDSVEESDGTRIDNRAAVQKKLDSIGLNYSLGTPLRDEYSVVVRVPAQYANEEFASVLCGSGAVDTGIKSYSPDTGMDICSSESGADPNFVYSRPDVAIYADVGIDSVEFADGVVKAFVKPEYLPGAEKGDGLGRCVKAAGETENKVYFHWGRFFGDYDETRGAFIFDKSVYNTDGSIPSECKYYIDLWNDYVKEKNGMTYTRHDTAVQYCTYDEMTEQKAVLLRDKSSEVIVPNLKKKIKSVLGVEPDVEYEYGSCHIEFYQDITENYATNVFRFAEEITDASINDNNGIFTIPRDSSIYMDLVSEDGTALSRVVTNHEMKYVTLVFWEENIPEDLEELTENQIFELQKMFQNDPMFADYDVSVTKVF